MGSYKAVMKYFSALLIALQFLTRIPLPKWLPVNRTEQNTGLSQSYYALIGLLIGAMLYGISLLLTLVVENTLLNSSLLVLFWVIITGALHIDGLADSMDAWIGGYGDREKTLAIMHDPQSGPIAVVAIVMVLLIKVIALSNILAANTLVILFIPMLARLVLPFNFMFMPYLRNEGLGKSISAHSNRLYIGVLAVICLVPFFLLLKILAVYMFIAWVIFNLLLARLLMARFGGLTGDIAGLILEVNEAMLLVSAVLLAYYS